jgi:hypothetical protein
MKLVQGIAQPKLLNEIKTALVVEFKKPESESQCITELKEIKKRVVEPVWEFDQRLKTLTGRLTFQIRDEQGMVHCFPPTTHQSPFDATKDCFIG